MVSGAGAAQWEVLFVARIKVVRSEFSGIPLRALGCEPEAYGGYSMQPTSASNALCAVSDADGIRVRDSGAAGHPAPVSNPGIAAGAEPTGTLQIGR